MFLLQIMLSSLFEKNHHFLVYVHRFCIGKHTPQGIFSLIESSFFIVFCIGKSPLQSTLAGPTVACPYIIVYTLHICAKSEYINTCNVILNVNTYLTIISICSRSLLIEAYHNILTICAKIQYIEAYNNMLSIYADIMNKGNSPYSLFSVPV